MTESIDLKELIGDFNNYINKVSTGSINIAGNLRGNNMKQALNEISNFGEGMNWIISASNYFKMNDVELEFDEQKIVGFLQEINEGLTVQDYFLVADLFEYEIAEYFAELPEVIINN